MDHTHTTIVEGCYRCELGMDEVTGLTNTTAREYEAYMAGHKQASEDHADDLEDLKERLEKAVTWLGTVLDNTLAWPLKDALREETRLKGKIEGVRLALDYLRVLARVEG